MKKTIFIIAALLPALAFAAKESAVKRFDRQHEDFLFADKERPNPTTNEMLEMAREQGTLTKHAASNQGKPAPTAVGIGNRPVEGTPAPAYRTMGEAAKAGIDPLKLIKPMESKAPVPEANKNEIWFYAGGFTLFAFLGFLGFMLVNRNRGLRES